MKALVENTNIQCEDIALFTRLHGPIYLTDQISDHKCSVARQNEVPTVKSGDMLLDASAANWTICMNNPLFYNRVVPLDSDAHRDLLLGSTERPLAFAQDANLIPALIDEFVTAAPHLPIAFLPGPARPAAVFVVGTKPGSNVFIDEAGKWNAAYMPAYLRRYPFIMGDVPDSEPILCIDESFDGLGKEGGQRLFSETGEATDALRQALALADNYRIAALRTDRFCDALQSMGLLRSVTLDVKLGDGGSNVVHGLMVLDEAAFDALEQEKLMTLHRDNMLKPLLAQLISLSAIDKLAPVAKRT